MQHPGTGYVLGWAPDGKTILFSSNRNGSMGMWALEMAGDKPVGEPKLVKAATGEIAGLGFGRNGAFFYRERVGTGNEIYIAAIDPSTGTVEGTPKLASSRYMGVKEGGVFSPDGQYLVYEFQARAGFGRRSMGLSVLSLETGQDRELVPRLPLRYGGALGHNGEEIQVTGLDVKGRLAFFRVDPVTGDVTLRQQTGFLIGGNKRVFPQPQTGGGVRYMVRNEETGEEKVLSPERTGGFQNMMGRPSPDRQWLVFRSQNPTTGAGKLVALPTSGGAAVDLVTANRRDYLEGAYDWFPDSKHVIYTRGRDGRYELWRISVQGGQPEKLGLTMDGVTRLNVHADGKRIAVSVSGKETHTVWVMENYRTELRTSR